MNNSGNFLVRIEYFIGQHGVYNTVEGPLLLADHELTHEEAMDHFDTDEEWDIAGIYYIDSDPMINLRCPHCQVTDFGVVSEFLWQTNEQGVLLACCPACYEGISAEEILKENR